MTERDKTRVVVKDYCGAAIGGARDLATERSRTGCENVAVAGVARFVGGGLQRSDSIASLIASGFVAGA